MSKLNFEILEKQDKKRLLKELSAYGIEKLPYLIVKWGKRLRMFSGSIDKETIFLIMRVINVDSIGLYFASIEEGVRLSLDASHLLASQIGEGFLEINDSQAEEWFKGKSIELDEKQKKEIDKFNSKIVFLKNGKDIVGVGKRGLYGITNFMPKERRIKQ